LLEEKNQLLAQREAELETLKAKLEGGENYTLSMKSAKPNQHSKVSILRIFHSNEHWMEIRWLNWFNSALGIRWRDLKIEIEC
jgi:hypothetical protein